MLGVFFYGVFCNLTCPGRIGRESGLSQGVRRVHHHCDWAAAHSHVQSGEDAELRVGDIDLEGASGLGGGRILNIVNSNLEGLQGIDPRERWLD